MLLPHRGEEAFEVPQVGRLGAGPFFTVVGTRPASSSFHKLRSPDTAKLAVSYYELLIKPGVNSTSELL